MKLLLIIAMALFIQCNISDAKTVKHKNTKSVTHKKHLMDIEKELQTLKDMEAELEAEIVEEERHNDNEENIINDEEGYDNEDEETNDDEEQEVLTPEEERYFDDNEQEIQDPCYQKYCDAGRECKINEEGLGVCQCVASCNEIDDDRRKICSNHNETWSSDCSLYKQRCHCAEEDEKCQNKKYEHVHIEYYGACQEMPECEPNEMVDFPRRMTEWLFTIMRDMAERHTLSSHYLQMEQEAENDLAKKWTNAVVWKWCELDGEPRDKSVSRHELFPIRAPLFTLEHCISPFLDSCDADNDHYLTLKEWANCLKLDKDNIEELEELCEDVRDV